MKVLTLEEIRLYLGMNVSDTEHDELLTALEAEAFATVQRLTGRRLSPTTAQVTEIVSGNDLDSLFVTNPVTALVSVRYRFATDWSDPWAFLTTDPSADLRIDGRRLYWNTGSVWPIGENNIEITYTTGYPNNTFPDDLRSVMKELIADKFRGRPQATPTRVMGGRFRGGLSDTAKSILHTYRRPGR